MEQLAELLEEILGVPVATLDEETPFRDLADWSSLKHVQLVVGIQATFGLDLERDEIRRLDSLAGVRIVLSERQVLA